MTLILSVNTTKNGVHVFLNDLLIRLVHTVKINHAHTAQQPSNTRPVTMWSSVTHVAELLQIQPYMYIDLWMMIAML